MVLETVGVGGGRLAGGVVLSWVLGRLGSILGSAIGAGGWILDESIALPELF